MPSEAERLQVTRAFAASTEAEGGQERQSSSTCKQLTDYWEVL